MTLLVREITAEIRRIGKRYVALETLLPTMTEPQLRDLLHLIRDTKDDVLCHARSQARRMGSGWPR